MKKSKTSALEVKYPYCAGIDIAKSEHWVAARDAAGDEVVTRQFGGYTENLEDMARWLHEFGVQQVAMEATGVYWIPAFELLDRSGFEVWLVNPHQTKRRDGRKSDALDCQWIQQLMSYGLLNRSHRPKDQVCELRAYVRQRTVLMQQRARCVQHLQKALEQMNVHLSTVLSDITGKSGMAIIEAIVSGVRDGKQLAKLCDPRVRRSQQEIAAALRGNWRDEHLFSLQLALSSYHHYNQQIEETEQCILAKVVAFGSYEHCVEPQTGECQPICEAHLRTPARTAQQRRMQVFLWRVYGVDLTAIPGVAVNTVLTLLSEIGPDLSAFPDEAHFCSWLALSPNTRISGGKRLTSRGPRRTQTAGQALRMAAMTLRNSKSFLGAKHRNRCWRLDTQKAIKASAHQLGRLIYAMVTKTTEYVEYGEDAFEKSRQERNLKNFIQQARRLGIQLTPEQLPQAA